MDAPQAPVMSVPDFTVKELLVPASSANASEQVENAGASVLAFRINIGRSGYVLLRHYDA